MLKELVKYAEKVKNKYSFEIDGCIKASEVFKAKFKNDQEKMKYICSLLYKKLN